MNNLKQHGFEWGDVIVISLTSGKKFIALIEEAGRLSTSNICPIKTIEDELPNDLDDLRYAEPKEIRSFIRELILNGRLLHYGFDTVNKPVHYADSKIECIDAMEAAFGTEKVMDFCLCNSFKYIWRSQKKNGVEDLKKAMWYENKYIELEKKLNGNA